MFDPDLIRSARLRRLHAYWTAKRGERPMTSRADIDPVEMRWILGNLSLIEVRGGGDYVWRLDGSKLADFFGCDMTGRSIVEYPYANYVETLRSTFDAAVAAGGPFLVFRGFSANAHRWNYENLILPLSQDGTRVDMLMQAMEIAPA